jgi:hypothetical protein
VLLAELRPDAGATVLAELLLAALAPDVATHLLAELLALATGTLRCRDR